MKILKNKTYNELLEYKDKYLDLLWKPFRGVFEKVTDDDLLRNNAALWAENEDLENKLSEVKRRCEYLLENNRVKINNKEYIKQDGDDEVINYIYNVIKDFTDEWPDEDWLEEEEDI